MCAERAADPLEPHPFSSHYQGIVQEALGGAVAPVLAHGTGALLWHGPQAWRRSQGGPLLAFTDCCWPHLPGYRPLVTEIPATFPCPVHARRFTGLLLRG